MDASSFYSYDFNGLYSQNFSNTIMGLNQNNPWLYPNPAEKYVVSSLENVELIETIPIENTDPIPNNQSNRRKYTLWTPDEDHQLRVAVEKYGNQWSLVCQEVTDSYGLKKTKNQCISRWNEYLNPLRNKSEFSESEKAIILHEVIQNGNHSWTNIAKILGNNRVHSDIKKIWNNTLVRNLTDQEFEKYSSSLKPQHKESLKKNRSKRKIIPWTKAEDQQLIKSVNKYGNQWFKICTEIKDRSKFECRRRWKNHLMPGLSKNEFTEEENEWIIFEVAINKNTSWKKIAEILLQHCKTTRTQDAIKSKWNKFLKLKVESGEINLDLIKTSVEYKISFELLLKSSDPQVLTEIFHVDFS